MYEIKEIYERCRMGLAEMPRLRHPSHADLDAAVRVESKDEEEPAHQQGLSALRVR